MKKVTRRFILPLLIAALASASGAMAMEDQDCLGCHNDVSVIGEERFINLEIFDATAHAQVGCSTCHPNIADAHPEEGSTPVKAECGSCHDDMAAQYGGSAHAGSATCGDCHNPHSVRSTTEVSGHDMNRQCAQCHVTEEMITLHNDWLPQADLHVTMLPCISCHSGSESYVITLYLTMRETDPRYGGRDRRGDFEVADHGALQALAGDAEIESLIDTDDDGKISLDELRVFNGERRYESIRLKGMMMPERVTHDLQIMNNRWDCTFCHASGPEAMQSSFVALPDKDGTFRRIEVEKGAVLDALGCTPDFYMLGATRNRTLNYIGLAIMAGGLVMPIGHGSLRLLTRNNRRKGGKS
jgi:hypothetical protein